jgi:hypothetical protein
VNNPTSHIREAILNETEAFGGLQPADRIFRVTGYGLKPVRRWRHESLGFAGEPEFSISISGIAIADTDDVQIIGADRSSKEDTVTIGIKWIGGLIRNGGSLGPLMDRLFATATWGMFTLPRRYVTRASVGAYISL